MHHIRQIYVVKVASSILQNSTFWDTCEVLCMRLNASFEMSNEKSGYLD